MNVSVLGCGRWGSFLAWYSAKIGNKVILWGKEDAPTYLEISEKRANEYLTIQDNVEITNSLDHALDNSEVIIISISSQSLRGFLKEVAKRDSKKVKSKTYVLCMKGIEAGTGKRLSQIFKEEIGEDSKVAVWVGPGHPQDYVNNIPNCMVISSDSTETMNFLVTTFGSDLIRFYYSEDVIGNEIGAATKNVMGIAAGMLDGLSYTSLKGALMSRGTREISKLIKAMGGNEFTAYGLSHLGDYEATLFSKYSNNRGYGEMLVKGKMISKLAEGVETVRATIVLSEKYSVDLPICKAVYSVVHEKKDIKEVLTNLFLRENKFEFER